MRPKNPLRRGSALLIVLGMMSFMLFSGLAFAVYMRYARLPTSFLRRTTATRQLTKAALAEAIEEIDRAIGDDAHPGVHNGAYKTGVTPNSFVQRVFFGTDLRSTSLKSITPIDSAPTVLTLEGLAYLPPNLINDVRYFSRCTPTAEWQSFWFDSGRYAYVAVDVTDYFDVNRIKANARRAASASQRISLAHLFETIQRTGDEVDHTGAGSGAEAWDQFIESACGDNEPFISLADFNIAWNGNSALSFGAQSVESPFSKFVKTGYAYGQNMTAADPKAEYYRQLTFVTDSWSPQPERTDGIKVADLENGTYQPFKQSDLESKSSLPIEKVITYNSELLEKESYLGGRLSDFTRIALWDYLDENVQPLSLAVPTCERVPMVCAIQPEFNGTFKVSKQAVDKAKDRVIGSRTVGKTTYEIVQRDVTYEMDFTGVGKDLSGFVCWTYPFLQKGLPAEEKFSMDGRVGIFLTDPSTTLSARPSSEIKGLFWDKSDVSGAKATVTEVAAVYPFKPQSASSVDPKTITTSVGGDKAPVQELMFKAENAHASVKRPLVTVTFQWERNKTTQKPEDPQYDMSEIPAGGIKQPEGSDLFGLLKQDGSRDSDFEFLRTGSKKAKVNVAVSARVMDNDQKTVDLAPACLMDDNRLNGVNNSIMGVVLGNTDSCPLLKLEAGEVELSIAKFESGEIGTYAVSDKALVTGDPRFNHAPENWQLVSGVGSGLAPYWYNRENAIAKERDGDIYMATSDQAYLQSLYELMMLPRIQNGISKSGVGANYLGSYSTTFDGKIRSDGETLKDRDFMWRTYQPSDFTEIADGRIVTGDSGPKVNPYSDSTNVLMAAFANTPHDWRVASTNNDDIADDMDAAAFNREYAWNSYSATTGGKLCWECLSKVASAFSDEARYLGDWEKAFRELDWSRDPKKILSGNSDIDQDDGDNGKLYSVDKKFLYGFWHDSFSARQQLFLIFVRAEPMMMGGGVAGHAPPQLGARAVALVWRDPSPFKDAQSSGADSTSQAPVHRTRILFYHQFD